MKKILGIVALGLFLITPSYGDDVQDFQIEGVGIGNSLLDYFSEEEIIKYTQEDQYPNDKYIMVTINYHASFKKYDAMQIDYLKNDKKYIIASLGGAIYYEDNNISECYKELRIINSKYSKIYTDAQIQKFEGKKAYDKSGKSKYESVQYFLPSGDVLMIQCDDWSKKMNEENNFPDALTVSYATKPYFYFMVNEAYK